MKHGFTGCLRLLACLIWFGAVAALPAIEDRAIGVAKNDPEMNKAMADARAHLPHFWRVMTEAKNGEEEFSVKVRVADGRNVEYFWCTDLKLEQQGVTGEIGNDPEIVKTVQAGQRIVIKEPEIVDWLYLKGGKMIGNYTCRPLMKSMNKDELAYLKEQLGELPE